MTGCQPIQKIKRPDCIACNGGVWGGIYPPTCICNNISNEIFEKFMNPAPFPKSDRADGKDPKPITLSETFDMEWTKKQIEDLHALVTDLRCENKELKTKINGEITMRQDLRDYCFERLGRPLTDPNILEEICKRLDKLESRIVEVEPTVLGRILNSFEMQMVSKIEKIEEFKDASYDQVRIFNEVLLEIKEKIEKHDIYLNNQSAVIHKLDGDETLINRIMKLEDVYKADFETAKEIIFAGAQTHASILRCEAEIKKLKEHQSKTPLGESGRYKTFCHYCNGEGVLYVKASEENNQES